MGLGDKFKDAAKQARESVADHKDQLHDVVDAVGVAADRKTRGRYTTRIAKLGEKAGGAVDKLAAQAEDPATPKPGSSSQRGGTTQPSSTPREQGPGI